MCIRDSTYPLPEAQLDRFLMFIKVDYPSELEEIEILRRTTGNTQAKINAVLNAQDIINLQHVVRDIEVAEPLLVYINQLVRNTRPGDSQASDVNEYVRWGAGPRAGQAMVLCAKANALLSKRFVVTMQDIKQVAHGVLRHRLLLSFQAQAQNISSDDVVDGLLQDLAEPASPFAASV